MQHAQEEIKTPESWLKDIKGECDIYCRHFPFTARLTRTFSGLRFFHAAFVASCNQAQSWTPFSFSLEGHFSQWQKECVCRPLSLGRPGFDVSRAVPTRPGSLCQEITAPSLRSPTGCWEKRCAFDVLKKDLLCSLSSLLFCLWFIQTFSQVRSDSLPQYQNKQRNGVINGQMRARANIEDVLENVTAAVKISNSVNIVAIWVVNLYFSFASARSVGCNSGFWFFILLSETVVVHSHCSN